MALLLWNCLFAIDSSTCNFAKDIELKTVRGLRLQCLLPV